MLLVWHPIVPRWSSHRHCIPSVRSKAMTHKYLPLVWHWNSQTLPMQLHCSQTRRLQHLSASRCQIPCFCDHWITFTVCMKPVMKRFQIGAWNGDHSHERWLARQELQPPLAILTLLPLRGGFFESTTYDPTFSHFDTAPPLPIIVIVVASNGANEPSIEFTINKV